MSTAKTRARPARQLALKRSLHFSLQLSLQFADARHRALLPRHLVARWIRAALEADAQITVRIVGAEEGQRLNREFRARDYATNVLTFDYAHAPLVVADLVLCAPVLEAEARAQRIDLTAHYAHLVVHGTLHAQGYDHELVRQARRMEARESEVLQGLGFADPYGQPDTQLPSTQTPNTRTSITKTAITKTSNTRR